VACSLPIFGNLGHDISAQSPAARAGFVATIGDLVYYSLMIFTGVSVTLVVIAIQPIISPIDSVVAIGCIGVPRPGVVTEQLEFFARG
jgi:hypothetical protein